MDTSLRRSLPVALVLVVVGAPAMGQSVSFQRDVLPILSDRCFPCHGPDGNARQSGLRLDTESSALRTTDPVVVPHKSSESKLIAKITATDPGERMPPADSNLSLSEAEIETLKRWIDEGAHWERHWAFAPPEKSKPPIVADSAWPENGIDRFVLARLERAGLRPTPRAERGALLRRVTLDLTGLPPTLEEVDAFLADTAADAYERVVDRLLRSPRYGERMAWEWLDAARYADTDGFQADPTRTMWPWRDWLINSLNDNLPFDHFTVEALAGDLIPDATPEQVVASGFNRNHMYNGEGGRIAEETRIENVFDRTETTATVWMGLTMTCARCHDHKYDPVTQEEYYRLFAFFDQTSESGAGGQGKAPPTIRYQTAAQRARRAAVTTEIENLSQRMRGPDPEIDAGQRAWEEETLVRLRRSGADLAMITLEGWHLIGPLAPPGGNGGNAFDKAYGPERGVDLARRYEGGKKRWRAAPELVDGGVHALDDGLGATYLYRVARAPSARSVDISLGSDDSIQVWLNGAKVFSKNVARGVAANQERTRLELVKGRNDLLLKIVNTGGAAGVYFRKIDETIGGMPGPIVRALLVAGPDRDDGQRRLLLEHYREKSSPKWRASAKRLAVMNAERTAIDKRVATVMVMDTLPAARRRASRILERGAYDRPLAAVKEATPAFLPPMPADARKDRMSLARWLVADENPLTARVTVNRHWQTFFGRGLVETIENFGQQGALPSHPHLLDWLARTFVSGGWDVKALHKLIVTSATYRQSARSRREAYASDPYNILLARGPRFRMPSWMLRDQALALGGLLNGAIGGPSVRPYQPDGIWAEATFGKIRYRADRGGALYRRSLYVFWRRIVGPTVFFDTGKRQTCVVKQVRTNSPLHALTTLNETAFVEAARFFAERVLRDGGDDLDAKIRWAFRAATSRHPSQEERDILVARWRVARADFARDPARAKKLLAVGASPRDASLDFLDHAAYTVVCSVILNLDEVLSKP